MALPSQLLAIPNSSVLTIKMDWVSKWFCKGNKVALCVPWIGIVIDWLRLGQRFHFPYLNTADFESKQKADKLVLNW